MKHILFLHPACEPVPIQTYGRPTPFRRVGYRILLVRSPPRKIIRAGVLTFSGLPSFPVFNKSHQILQSANICDSTRCTSLFQTIGNRPISASTRKSTAFANRYAFDWRTAATAESADTCLVESKLTQNAVRGKRLPFLCLGSMHDESQKHTLIRHDRASYCIRACGSHDVRSPVADYLRCQSGYLYNPSERRATPKVASADDWKRTESSRSSGPAV